MCIRDSFNTGDNHGCGYFQVTEKDGFRCSTSVGYLNPIKDRKNLEIITHAHVKKINFENKTAKEVEFWQGRPNRLHDRISCYLENGVDWKVKRLAP